MPMIDGVNMSEYNDFCYKIRQAVFYDNVDALNKIYEEYDYSNATLLELITLLRKSAVYKKQIPLWTFVIITSYRLCLNMKLNPYKELHGLI